MSKLTNFIMDMQNYDIPDDEKELLNNIEILANASQLSRDEFEEVVEDIFGAGDDNPLEVHDRMDLHDMLDIAKTKMPKDAVQSIDENQLTEVLVDEALSTSKAIHPAVLAIGLTDAIENTMDIAVAPSTLLDVNDAAIAKTVTEKYEDFNADMCEAMNSHADEELLDEETSFEEESFDDEY